MSNRLRPRLGKVVFAVILLVVLGSGCSSRSMTPPAAMAFSPVPKPVDVTKLCADYESGIAQAESLYTGKRYYLANLKVDRVLRTAYTPYIICGNMWFEPSYLSYLENIGEGTEIDIVGRCDTYSEGHIFFRDCWVQIKGGVVFTTRPGY